MRRLDRNIERIEDIFSVLDRCKICRLGMVDGEGKPYVVPLNFCYEYRQGKLNLYMHCAKEGLKLDLLRAKPSVCFEADNAGAVITADQACGYSQKYESVIAFGEAEILSDPAQREKGLQAVMKIQSGQDDWVFDPNSAARVEVIRVRVSSVTGKRHL
ncbi:MAG: pyridoxamine 5'-phosphate oxidase family protein [Crenarchaeota archaeon]|nr:pyridoxamine 5'-phosphate oxidase family protein [Thermoproteota archaeon]